MAVLTAGMVGANPYPWSTATGITWPELDLSTTFAATPNGTTLLSLASSDQVGFHTFQADLYQLVTRGGNGATLSRNYGWVQFMSVNASAGVELWSPVVALNARAWNVTQGLSKSCYANLQARARQQAAGNPSVQFVVVPTVAGVDGNPMLTLDSITATATLQNIAFDAASRNIGSVGNPAGAVFSQAYYSAQQTYSGGGAIVINPQASTSNILQLGATATTAVTISACPSFSQDLTVMIKQDATGGRAVPAAWTNVSFAGGASSFTATANKTDVYTFTWDNTSALWREKSRSLNQ